MSRKLILASAIVLGTVGLLANRPARYLPGLAFTTPQIVASVAVTNRTTTIPPTTVFTPSQNGLFRVSIYMVETAPQLNGAWLLHLSWTDDAGTERTYQPMIQLQASSLPPQAWGSFDGAPGNVVMVEGVAGQPIIYEVTGEHSSNGAFSLYMVVEQLQ